MEWEDIIEGMDKFKTVEDKLRFLNNLLKDIEGEELKEKIRQLMQELVKPDRGQHFMMTFEPSEIPKVPEATPIERRVETPGEREPEETGVPLADVRGEEELQTYEPRVEESVYTKIERQEEEKAAEAPRRRQTGAERLVDLVPNKKRGTDFVNPTFDNQDERMIDLKQREGGIFNPKLESGDYETIDEKRKKMKDYKEKE